MRRLIACVLVLMIAFPALALDQLTQYGLTWTFVQPNGDPATLTTDETGTYQYGTYLLGDYWVRSNGADPNVYIVSITPASSSAGVEKNGSMINPVPGPMQGYDEEILYSTYSSALNVGLDLGAANLLVVPPNSSLISTVSAVGSDYLQVETQAILTVVTSAPAANSFRPPYCGTDKSSEHTLADLDYTVLKSLPRAPSTPSLTAPYGPYNSEAFDSPSDWFDRPWVDHGSETAGNHMHPYQNMPWYGRELGRYTAWAGLLLNFDFSDAQKTDLLIGYMQYAIDLEGVVNAGGHDLWKGNGTITSGRKLPLVIGSLVLDDAGMAAVIAKSGDYQDQGTFGNPPADYVNFLEDDQTHYVTQDDVDATNNETLWNPDDRAADLVPYDANDIGLAEWGIRHAEDPYQNNKHWSAVYRTSSSAVTAMAALVARIMDVREEWGRRAMFDYADRYVTYIWSAAFEAWAQTTHPTDYAVRIDNWRFGSNGFEWDESDPWVQQSWDLYWDDPNMPAGPTQVYKYITTAGSGTHSGDEMANSYSLSELVSWYSTVSDQDANNIDVTLVFDGDWSQGAVTTNLAGTRTLTDLTMHFLNDSSITASTTVLDVSGGNVLIDGAHITMEPAATGKLIQLSSPTAGSLNVIRNCVLRVNNATGKTTSGINSGLDLSGTLVIDNCEITFGTGVSNGAGILSYANSIYVIGCTLHGWEWGTYGDGNWVGINSISAGTDTLDWYTASGTMQLYSCASEDGSATANSAGGTCFDGTIPFVSVATRDYRLSIADANFVDAGIDPTTVFADWDQDSDLAGLIRVWDGDGDGARTIDIGAYEYDSEVANATPAAFDLGGPVTEATLDTAYTSDPVTVTSVNLPVSVDVVGDGATYNINAGSYTVDPGTVQPGDVVRVQVTSASTVSTERIATLTIGGVSDAYSVTTASSAPDTTPPTPNPPTGLSAIPISSTRIDLSWNAPSDDTTPITTRIQISLEADFDPLLNTVTTQDSSYSFTTGDPATTYWFRIRHEDAVSPTPNVTSYSVGASAETYYPTPTGTSRRMRMRYE